MDERRLRDLIAMNNKNRPTEVNHHFQGNDILKVPTPRRSSILSPTSQMAFAVALCALAAAGVGTIVNHWLTGWMAVGGMVGVGLFYLAIGLLNLRTQQPVFDEDASNVSQRTANAENLVGEAVTQSGNPTISMRSSQK